MALDPSSMPGATAPDAGARVLIVDDEPNIVLSLEFLLKSNGHAIAVARSGDEALRIAAQFRPHLVVLDIMLPVVNGFEVCRALRADPQHKGVRILMLTARGRDTEMKRGMAEGADDYLTKPFSTHELGARVAALLRRPAGGNDAVVARDEG